MNTTSNKQRAANRENGKKGGVKSDAGKAISRYNALKHGLLSEQILMDGEDETTLLKLEKRLRTDLQPATEMELLLVDRIATSVWRLKRALAFEKNDAIYTSGVDNSIGLRRDADLFVRYETMLERSIYKALHELQRQQNMRNGENTPPPIAIDIDVSKDD